MGSDPSKRFLKARSPLYFPVRSFASSLVSSASYLVYSGGAILVIELNRSFMLDRWIFDHVFYSRANIRVSYTQ